MASKHRTPTMTEPRKGNQVDRIIAERTLTARHEAAQAKHKAEQAAQPPAMTLQQAKEQLAGLGYTIARTGHGAELRVAPKDGTPASREERAYYTDDLADAVGTVKGELDRLAHRQGSFIFIDPKGELSPAAPGKAAGGLDPLDRPTTPAKTGAAPQRRRKGPGAGL